MPPINTHVVDGIDEWFADGREALRAVMNVPVLQSSVQAKLDESPAYQQLVKDLALAESDLGVIGGILDLVRLVLPLILKGVA